MVLCCCCVSSKQQYGFRVNTYPFIPDDLVLKAIVNRSSSTCVKSIIVSTTIIVTALFLLVLFYCQRLYNQEEKSGETCACNFETCFGLSRCVKKKVLWLRDSFSKEASLDCWIFAQINKKKNSKALRNCNSWQVCCGLLDWLRNKKAYE